MKRLLVLSIAAFLAFSLAGCGEDDDKDSGNNNPTGPTYTLNENAGTLTARPNAPNVAVTEANAAEVSGQVQSNGMSAGSKAMSAAMGGLGKAATAINSSITGAYSGTATCTGDYTINMTTGGMTYKILLTLSDYSDDGNLYLAGTILYDIVISTDMTGTGSTTYTYVIEGKIRFNGSFEGTNHFVYDMTADATGGTSYTYTSTMTSNGQTITYSYP